MATQTVPQPTAPYRLFVNGSRDFDIDPPDIGEAILLRLPFAVALGPPSIISSAVTGATHANYHLCFVAGQVELSGSVVLTVWVCLGFSSARHIGLTPNEYVQSLSADWQACLLPLAFGPQVPPAPRLPGPALFGTPLHIGGFLSRKPCFLNVRAYPVTISDTSAVCLPLTLVLLPTDAGLVQTFQSPRLPLPGRDATNQPLYRRLPRQVSRHREHRGPF